MPSFSLFSLPSSNEQENPLSVKADTIQRDFSIDGIFVAQDASDACSSHDIRDLEHKEGEFRRGVAATMSRAIINIQSERKHTIELGELDNLDLMVSDSVIR